MLNIVRKIADVTKRSPLELGTSLVQNLMIKLTVTDQKGSTSTETINQLLVRLQEFANPFSNVRVDDYAHTPKERLYAGEGFYTPIFAGCRVFVVVQYFDKTEKPYVSADIYIPHIYRNKIYDIMTDINPSVSTLPRVYSFPRDGHYFYRTIAAETFTGYLDAFYGEQKQLIDPNIYGRIDRVLDRFTHKPDWYPIVGRQHRETFLIYGPPGTGKTNLIRHFASKYGLNLVVGTLGRGIPNIRMLLNTTLKDRNTIVLFEDIDSHESLCIKDKTEEKRPRFGQDDSGDYSDFLNFLDGVRPLKNVVVFMTTNFIDKLKDPIYRPGRVNHKIELSYPSFETVLNSIGFEEGDERLEYLKSLEMKQLPLDNIVSIRCSETLDEVREIIAGRDLYYELSSATGEESSSQGRNRNVKTETVA